MFTKQEENHVDQIPASSTTQIVPLLSSYYCALAILNSILCPDSESNTSHNKHRSKRSSSTSSNTFSLCHDMPSGLKIVHWNLHSIAPHQGNTKLDELKLLLSNPGKECHILGITETWLDANFTDSEIQIPEYNLERLDRAKVSLPFPDGKMVEAVLQFILMKTFHIYEGKILNQRT